MRSREMMVSICKPLILVVLSCLTQLAAAEFSREYIDSFEFKRAQSGDIEIAYKDVELPTGMTQNTPVVLIMGLGSSHTLWGDNFVKGLADAGFRLILIDNRDVGKSSKFTEEPTIWWELLKNSLGFEVNAPYLLNDMASDVVAVMDALEIDQANIVGASMGGMIAQIIAADYPERVTHLVSIMSTTGAPHLPTPSADASNAITDMAEGDAAEELKVRLKHMGLETEAIPRQLMAIIKTGDRSEQVKTITAPTLVLHGEDDTLLQPEHGEHTASLIAGSRIKIFPGMGHNLPDAVLPALLESIVAHLKSK